MEFPARATATQRSLPWEEIYRPVRDDLEEVAGRVAKLAGAAAAPLGEAASILATGPGKLLRPALLLLSALAGPPAPPARAARARARRLAAAAAFELLHLASLTHDDILDFSDSRRGRPTAWKRWGPGVALLAGDHLYGKAVGQASLAGCRGSRSLCRTIDALLTGEALQLQAAGRNPGRRAYLALATAKTAVFCAESCGLGAALSGAGREVVAALRAYGRALGQTYQLTDDLLDWVGDPAATGKPCRADLLRGHFTFPVVAGLARWPGRVGRAVRALETATRSAAEDVSGLLAGLGRLLEAAGAFEETRRRARLLVARAVDSLGLLPPGTPRENLAALAESMVDRIS